MSIMNLKCVELKNNYYDVMIRLINKIIMHHSKSVNGQMKSNIKHKNTDINNDDIIKIFYDVKRPFLDEKVNNLIFKKLVDKIVSELTSLFVHNSDDSTMTDKMIINFDVMTSELSEALIGIAKMSEFESAFVSHAFRKIKLIEKYYSYGGIDEEGIKAEFIAEYGNAELFEQLKTNKSKKKISLSKISSVATDGITKGLHFFKIKKASNT